MDSVRRLVRKGPACKWAVEGRGMGVEGAWWRG